MRQFLPTKVVRRGSVPSIPFPRAERDDLDRVAFRPIGAAESMTWLESLDANYTDGIVVLHRGTIVFERYFGVLAPERQHIAFSVTKSFAATLAALLVAEGAIDAERAVSAYIPELAPTGIGDASIRHLLDMTTGLDYTEDYTDPRSAVRALSNAGSFRAGRAIIRGRTRTSTTSRR
jgi:CubicO group peptidase (beta-lactamase class C family)